FPHVIGAGLLTGGLVVAGGSAYQLLRRHPEGEFFTRSLRLGVGCAALGALFATGFGYAQFGPILTLQPDKLEGNPTVATSLGFMMLIGDLLTFVVLLFLLPTLSWLPRWRWTHPIVILLTPLPFVASILGWLTREIGRYPWMINGRLTVADAMSPGLTPG